MFIKSARRALLAGCFILIPFLFISAATPAATPAVTLPRKFCKFRIEYVMSAQLLKSGGAAPAAETVLKTYPPVTVLSADFLVPEGAQASGAALFPDDQWIILTFDNLAADKIKAQASGYTITDNLARLGLDQTIPGLHQVRDVFSKGTATFSSMATTYGEDTYSIGNKAGYAKSITLRTRIQYLGPLDVHASKPSVPLLRLPENIQKQIDADLEALGTR